MKKQSDEISEQKLPTAALIVLSIIAEQSVHGYDIERTVTTRGFKFWTDIGKTSIYKSLAFLEERNLVKTKLKEGSGPVKKVFSITEKGKKILAQDGARLLSSPSHPRSEVDLAIYLLPFLAHKEATAALETCLSNLKSRCNFLEERCKWCKTQELQLPFLAFERPLRLLEVEIAWLREVLSELRKNKKEFNIEGWRKYEYREPPG